jgi:uncharacterized cupin superfamily protein
VSNQRPPFIVSTQDVPEENPGQYKDSDELLSCSRRIGRAAGLLAIGINVERVPPGCRTSWPHAESKEEEFVYVLEGSIDAWVDGTLHRMQAGDFAAFPAGTGICHCFINNGDRDAKLLVGGNAALPDNRIVYPLNPSRRAQLPWSHWWDDAPKQPMGAHDGLPDAAKKR